MTAAIETRPHRRPAHAIILAAGRGTRLGDAITRGGPKCLVRVGGRSILERQVAALAAAGVREVRLVIGFEADTLRAACTGLAARYGVTFSFVENPMFAETNTVYSQYLARDWLDRPVYCLNGDVVFPADLPERLARTPGDAVLAVDVKRCGDEEVKVVVGPSGISEIGKQLDPRLCRGEFIGVARYGATAARAFARALEGAVEREGRRLDYFELALARVVDQVRLGTLELHGEPLLEIDSPDDYHHACSRVAPRLDPTEPTVCTSAIQRAVAEDHARVPGCHTVSLGIEFSARLAERTVARALRALVQGEPLLHSTFHTTPQGLVRRVDPRLEAELEVADVRPEALRDALATEAARPLAIETRAPVRLRLHLLESSSILQITLHHLAYDAVSLVRYADQLLGHLLAPSPVEPARDRYADFVAWEETWLRSEEAARVGEGWRRALGDTPLTLPLGGDGEAVQLTESLALPTDAVMGPARAAGTMPLVTLLGAWSGAVGEWLGLPEVVLGTTMTLRTLPGFADLPGPIFNYVPLRVAAGDVVSARAALAQGLAGRAWPMALHAGRSPRVSLGLDANINYYDFTRSFGPGGARRTGAWTARLSAGQAVEIDGLRLRQAPIAEVPVVRPYALNLGIVRGAAGFRLGLRYRAGLLSATEARGLLTAAAERLAR